MPRSRTPPNIGSGITGLLTTRGPSATSAGTNRSAMVTPKRSPGLTRILTSSMAVAALLFSRACFSRTAHLGGVQGQRLLQIRLVQQSQEIVRASRVSAVSRIGLKLPSSARGAALLSPVRQHWVLGTRGWGTLPSVLGPFLLAPSHSFARTCNSSPMVSMACAFFARTPRGTPSIPKRHSLLSCRLKLLQSPRAP